MSAPREKRCPTCQASKPVDSFGIDRGRHDGRMALNAEVISGHGPGDILDYEDRPKVKKEAPK